ncbi:hypothetical protein ACHAXT_005061 [Thalassiosira profunda]
MKRPCRYLLLGAAALAAAASAEEAPVKGAAPLADDGSISSGAQLPSRILKRDEQPSQRTKGSSNQMQARARNQFYKQGGKPGGRRGHKKPGGFRVNNSGGRKPGNNKPSNSKPNPNKQKASPGSPSQSVCDANSYRTCFLRAADPKSNGECDALDRTKTIKPYATQNEKVITGTLTLSLLRDSPLSDLQKNMKCKDIVEMEEALLTYLADNVGSEETYQPICAHLKETAYNEGDVYESGKVSSAALMKFEVTFVTKLKVNNWRRDLAELEGAEWEGLGELAFEDEEEAMEETLREAHGEDGRALQNKKDKKKDKGKENGNKKDKSTSKSSGKPKPPRICTALETALCCSQNSINGMNPNSKEPAGQYCEKLRCDLGDKCGKGRDPTTVWDGVHRGNGWHDDGHRGLGSDGDEAEALATAFAGAMEARRRPGRSSWSGSYSWSGDDWAGGNHRNKCPKWSSPKADPNWYDNFDDEAEKGKGKRRRMQKQKRARAKGGKDDKKDNLECPAYGILKHETLNEVIRCLTSYDPKDTNAQLDLSNLDDAAFCAANRYALATLGKPTLECDAYFDDHNCGVAEEENERKDPPKHNDDLLPEADEILKSGKVCIVDDPTMSPSLSPTLFPTGYPTISPTFFPTESPDNKPSSSTSWSDDGHSSSSSSSSSSWSGDSWPGDGHKSTKKPTSQPTNNPSGPPSSREPTREPTNGPSGPPTSRQPTREPTNGPTNPPSSRQPTRTPTGQPTSSLEPQRELYGWGASQSLGEDLSYNLLLPTDVVELVRGSSAGYNYSLVVLNNGTAAAAGYVQSTNAYQGHLGLPGVTSGTNELRSILNVVVDGDSAEAPRFKLVVAGTSLDSTPNRMHSIFIDTAGNAYASGYNNKGQLCLGNEESRNLPHQITLPDDERAAFAAAGGDFTLILAESGKLYGCGTNERGQLGLGGLDKTNTPQRIGDFTATGIQVGSDFSIVRTDQGLYFMGNNDVGQLCHSTDGPVRTPSKQFDDDDVVSFAAGWKSSYVVNPDGTVTSCGLNDEGQLGDGTNDKNKDRTTVQLGGVISVSAGPSADSAFFVAEDGRVYGTGRNDRGQLGSGNTANSNVPVEVAFTEPEIDANVLSAGTTHTLAPIDLKTATELYTWGAQTSAGLNEPDSDSPSDTDLSIRDASAGFNYTLVINNDRSVTAAGAIRSLQAYSGHLGLENVNEGLNEGRKIENVINLSGNKVAAPRFRAVVAGDSDVDETGRMHSIFVDLNGNVYASGHNNKGQLCIGNDASQDLPTQIQLPNQEKAVSAAVGGEFTLILTNAGRLYGCGSNEQGQLWLGNDSTKDRPTLISGNGLSGTTAISAGHDFSLVVAGGEIYVMGDNDKGQLCEAAEVTKRTSPTKLSIRSNGVGIRTLAAGWRSSYFVFEDGLAYSCGLNDKGQLGDGTTSTRFSAVRVQRDNLESQTISDVFAGPSALSAFFKTDDGKIYATGFNNRGQLGVGNKVNRDTPTKVDFGDSNPSVVSAAESHSVAR